MAKKSKGILAGSPIGYPAIVDDGSATKYDNNPDGPSNKPKFSLNGYRYPDGKMCCPENVAAGEGMKRPDVTVNTANGIARTEGQNRGQQGNWDPTSSWAESKDWDGNLTGI